MFFETSAKTGINTKNVFNDMAKKLTGVDTAASSTPDGPSEAGKTTVKLNEGGEGGAAAGSGEKKACQC